MKKIFVVIICFMMILSWITNTYASEFLEPYYPTKEELGGNIDIPNKEGTLDHYTDINTYEELYSVLEDLSFEYRRLLEEYGSLEQSYEESMEEKDREIEALKDEIEYSSSNIEDDGSYKLIIIAVIIFIIVAIYNYFKK